MTRWLLFPLLLLSRVAVADSITGGSITGASLSKVSVTLYACNDTIDNDADGVADWPGDMGCTSPYDTDESGDTLVTVTGALSSANLATCIGGSSAPPNCDSTGAGGSVTVRSTSGTKHVVSGSWNPAQANVAVNGLTFVNQVTIEEADDGIRLVNVLFDVSRLQNRGGDDMVLYNSVFDGDADGTSCATERNNEIWCDELNSPICADGILRAKIIGNLFTRYFNQNQGDHSEAIYWGGLNQYQLLKDNDFEYNGTTGHIHFTWFPGNFGVDHPSDSCLTGNIFGPTGNEDLTTDCQFPVCGPGACMDISLTEDGGTYASVYIDPGQTYSRSGCTDSPFCTLPTEAACLECNDGIDNDGDGRADYWDGDGDPECSSYTDPSESVIE